MKSSTLVEKLLLQYHDKLNPSLWNGETLKNDVREKLLSLSKAWVQFSNISTSQIKDIIFTGSNANYNWVPNYSDIDIHIIINFENVIPGMSKETAEDSLYDKKVLWSNKHPNIRIYNYPVEFFAQGYDEYLDYIKNSSQRGVYSLTNNKWLVKPTYTPPISLSDPKLMKKVAYRRFIINRLIKNGEFERLKAFKRRLIESRGKGLSQSGEFNILNMAYKQLRDEGYLDKINKALNDYEDSQYSLGN